MLGVDLEELWDDRFVNAIAELFVQDSLITEEEGTARDKIRAYVTTNFLGYNDNGSYGRSNDDLGPMTPQAPRPYIPPTEFTDEGFKGLDPPVG